MSIYRTYSGLSMACLLLLPTIALAQSRPSTDPALGALIDRITDRYDGDLVVEKLPDGGEMIDLRGRFQQAALGQFIGGGKVMVGCVDSVGQANVFFGRDLYNGTPLPKAAIDYRNGLIERARQHGMSVDEYQFYTDLIDRSKSIVQPDSSTITIINNDGAGEGFNSAAAQFLPAPGNNGNANLGAQRLALFNAAAQVWGNFLDSSVATQVNAQFNSLAPCSTSGGVLGSAGATNIFRNFTNAEFTNTFYHFALANKQRGIDLNAAAEINATFNSDVDTGCLGAGTHFYYGLDNATPAGTINLFVVLLHEMGHGLGSSSFTGSNGVYLGNSGLSPDIWSRFMFDRTQNLTWFAMSDAQRAASALNTGNLLWNGANVRIASGYLVSGRDAGTGAVELFTPNPYQNGSSVSHYSTSASPNLLMEPAINSGLTLDLDLTRQQMRDIGWYRDTTADLVADTIINVAPASGLLAIGSAQTISWTNTGGFARNVTIELSLDGGTTYTVVVASDIANTGTFAWTVPNNPTTQARVRVREHNFVAPLGQSSANFTIYTNTAPTFTPAAAVTRQQGSASGAAVSIGSAADAHTAAGSLTVTQIAGGTATGISAAAITNTAGAITATLAASCTATAGTLRFQVSDGSLTGTGNLQVNVNANSVPTLTYANASVAAAAGTSVNPATGPSDNGSVASVAVQSAGTYTGTISVNAAGVVSISNAGPVGTHTITIRATDNCNTTTDATFQLQVTSVNTAPTFTPAAAVTRQQGSAAGAAVSVGTVADAQTSAGSLTVTQIAGGTATGISAAAITNTAGAVTATLAASCSATAGTLRFQVSDGSLNGTGDLQLNVNGNTAPTLTYANASVAAAAGTSVNPATGPTDNGSVASVAVQSAGTYTGTISVNAAGVVSISNAGPVGTHTITIRATDNCNSITDATFQLQVDNTAPTFTPAAAVTRQQGSAAGAAVSVGTVADAQTSAGSLTVTQVAGGTATGISAAAITNTAGAVTATLAASCSATAGTLRFQVSDGSLTGTGDLQLNVNANTAPTLTYANASVAAAAGTSVNPATGPTDNGSVASVAVQSAGTYTGTISVNAAGIVSISNAGPVGTHTITIRATDNCSSITDATFQLQVDNTAPTFTPAAAVTRQQGSVAGAAVSVGTVADAQTSAGSLTVTQVAGGTATGISAAAITNTAGAVTATLAASCSATAGTLRFQVSDGSLAGTGDLQLNVNANTAPTLTYANASVAAAAGTTVNPATGPTDNGSVASVAVQSAGTYTGTISVNAAGVVSIANAGPVGTHTITIRVTDNCNTTTDATFQLQVTAVNTAPTFTPAGAVTRQQGTPSGAAVSVGTAADAQTAAGSLTVTQIAGGTATGISAASITNTAGAVTATLAASCSATAGTLRFQVSDGSLTGTGDLQLNVNANTAPTLTYANASVAAAAGTSVNPATGPTDNGSVALIAVQSAGTYTGTISVNAAGVVSIANAGPVGTHTITVRATDNCNTITDATFQLQVNNTAPTLTPSAAITPQQGSIAGSPVSIGLAADAQTAAGSLTVTQIAGGTATGISAASITNSNGAISATVTAACSATAGTLRFQVSDGSQTATGDLQVNVIANDLPTMGNYAPVRVGINQSILVAPDAAPTDNGSITDTTASISPATYTGSLSVTDAQAGVVQLDNAQPVGNYTLTIRAVDNCNTFSERAVPLEVLIDAVFDNSFE